MFQNEMKRIKYKKQHMLTMMSQIAAGTYSAKNQDGAKTSSNAKKRSGGAKKSNKK